MKRSLNKSIAFAIIVVLFSFLLLVHIIVINLRQAEHTTQSIHHSSKVLSETNKILTLSKDFETRERGFVLTHDEQFLQPFTHAEKKLDDHLAALSSLVKSDKALTGKVKVLADHVKAKMKWSALIVSTRRKAGLDQAVLMIKSGTGRTLMLKIEELVADIDSNEKQRLHEKRAAYDAAVTNKSRAITAAFILLVVVVFALIKKILSELRTRHEAHRRASQDRERLAVTLESINDGVLATDLQGRVTLMNTIAENITGYTEEEALGRPIAEIFRINYSYDYFDKLNPVEIVLATGKTAQLCNGTPVVSKNGKEYVVCDSAAPIRSSDGKIFGVIMVFRDQTEKFNHMLQLKESEERFQLAAKATRDVIWDWNMRTGEMYWSEAYKILFGYGENSCKNIGEWSSRIHPEDRCRVMTSFVKKSQEKNNFYWEEEYRYFRANGSIAEVKDKGYLLYNDFGEAVRFVGAMQDVTLQNQLKRKLAEEEKRRHKEITDAVVAAQENERTEIGRELHDNVNQLLVSSKLYMEMARSDKENLHAFINTAIKYNKIAIEEIRTLSKALASPFIGDIDIAKAVRELANDFMGVQPISIFVAVHLQNQHELSDKFLLTLYRIVQEQLNNIIKHAKANNAWISLTQKDAFVHLQVRDDGVGFDTTAHRKGVGISNIMGRVSMYKGQMELSSAPGKGCDLAVSFKISDGLICDEAIHKLAV